MRNKFLNRLSLVSIVALIFSFCSLSTLKVSAQHSNTDTASTLADTEYSGLFGRATVTSASARKRSDLNGLRLYLGGMPFGVKFLTDGIIVSGFNDNATGENRNPAREAGLRINDVILSINGGQLLGATELNEAVERSNGKPISVKYSRGGLQYTASLTPVYSKAEGRYSLGIYVRDSGAGIGTITYVIPKTQEFAGLGHGICDAASGQLIPMQRGSVVGVKINGIVKGLSGSPGEVKGYFNSGKTGTLLGNTDCGVFGVLAELPKNISTETVEIGLRDSLKEGKAYICSQLDGEKVEKYEAEIKDIQKDATGNKCFTVKITDKRLISKTGGIIQGMSGSPIIQNGKLVGAVTHVLINDPTTGYGIFIENMLNAAQMPMAKAS